VTLRTPEARAYLERLHDLLPARDARRVVREVEALMLDRAEAEAAGGAGGDEAERRALVHLGSPEVLADSLVDAPLVIRMTTRRAFGRWLIVLIAGHLLLSLLLTLAKSDAAAIPGILAPLPRAPWAATVTAVIGIVLLDLGLLLALFAFLGGLRGRSRLPALALGTPACTRAEAVRGLVLLGLLAVLAHPLRDTVFAIRRGDQMVPFLAPDLVALVPWVDVLLGLCALRFVLVLVGRGTGAAALALDALAGLTGIALLLMASTRSEIVRLPEDALGAETAAVLSDLITRAFLVLFVGAALLLTLRVVKRLLRLKQVLAGAVPGRA
jgi:hypothetical protein